MSKDSLRKPNPRVLITEKNPNWHYKYGIEEFDLAMQYLTHTVVSSHRRKHLNAKFYFTTLGKQSGKIYNSHREALQAGIKYYLEHHQKIADELQTMLKLMDKKLGGER